MTTAAAPFPGEQDTAGRSHLAEAIAAIEALLRVPSSPAAAARISEARARWPHELRLLLFEGAWLQQAGRFDEAEACFRRAQTQHPANPWPGVRLTELFVARRRLDEAVATFTGQVWTGSAEEAVRHRLLSRISLALADLPKRGAFLSGLLRNTAEDRFVLLKLAALSFRQRDRSEAYRLFEAAKRLGPLPAESRLLELDLLLTFTRFDEALDLALELCRQHPERADFARRAIQAAHFANRLPEMTALLQGALTRWPGDWLLVFRYNRCTVAMDTDRALFASLSRHEAAMAADDRWLFQFAVACLRHGRTDRSLAILDRFASSSAVAPMALPLRAALRARPPSFWENARDISNDPQQDVQIRRVTDARATVVVLAGVQGGLGYLPFTHVDGLLGRHRVNAVYLRDLANRGFTTGVRRWGNDQASMVAALNALEGSTPVVTMGASLGGIAAVRIAALAGLHAAISFGGPVHLGADIADEDAPAPAGTRGTIFSSLTQADTSLVDLLRAAPRTTVHQCFGSLYAPDVAAAELLRGLPNAVLHAEAGCADHFVVEHMIAGGSFDTVLDDAIGSPAPTAP